MVLLRSPRYIYLVCDYVVMKKERALDMQEFRAFIRSESGCCATYVVSHPTFRNKEKTERASGHPIRLHNGSGSSVQP